MLVKTYGSAIHGIQALPITVEVYTGQGEKYYMVGLADNAIRESQQRIETALREVGLRMPRKKVVVNLAPADIRKEGSAYDLCIAMGILVSSEQVVPVVNLEEWIIMGELSLDGEIRPVRGALPIAIQAQQSGFRGIVLPMENAREAAIVKGLQVHGVTHLNEVISWAEGTRSTPPITFNFEEELAQRQAGFPLDFSDVKGQENIKRALEIAAAGGHNVILIGPPGAGKTMLARRIPSILPPLSPPEALEATRIHSVAGKLGELHDIIAMRPFRSPHHTISHVALVGGGVCPQPGEISLAHHGVLFLDELPEFDKKVLEVMRQPLEERKVTISRARYSIDYPASFMLIASMNPCPCGFYNHPEKKCNCPPMAVQKYLQKISGPLLDRIDLHIEVTPVEFTELSQTQNGESSSQVRQRVVNARNIQMERFKQLSGIFANAQLQPPEVSKICTPGPAGMKLLQHAMDKLNLSARAYERILKVSRTIADLAGSKDILTEHVAEAIHYRSLDRETWGN